MILSPYATHFTREHVAGKKNPERDMTNRKALERGWRNDRRLARLSKAV